MDINAQQIQAELQELAGDRKVKVKLNKSQEVACSTKETDKGITITFNPKRYRTPRKLEEHLDDLRRDMAWAS